MRPIPLLLAVTLLVSPTVRSQERSRPPSAYKVEFNIGEGKDATSPNRKYTLVVDDSGHGSFKVGNRIPVVTSTYQPGTGGNTPALNVQYGYVDVGVNIECHVRPVAGKVSIHGAIELSSVIAATGQAAANQVNPTVAQTRVEVDASLELGKPTMIVTIDDPATGRQLGVQANVTWVN